MTTPYDPQQPGGSGSPPDAFSPLGDSTLPPDPRESALFTDDIDSPSSAYPSTTDSESSTTETAKEQARQVKDSAGQATSQVAQTTQEQAQQVAGDVRQQARQLTDETKQQLHEQAGSQRDRAVSSLRSLGDELSSMSDNSSQSGLGTQLAKEGSQLTHQAADFLEQREPAQLLDEVRGLARRRPGAFLLGAAAAGVAVGRLTRGAMSARNNDSYDSSSSGGFATDQTQGLASPSVGDYSGGVQADPLGYEAATMPGQWVTPAPYPVGGLEPPPAIDEPYGDQLPPQSHPTGSGGWT